MPRALVTGATGQVGHHVVERLQKDGWEVRALVRDAARAGALSRAGVTLATGDVLDATSMAVAARRCDLVVHAAAAVTPRGGWEAFRRPNVEGTRNAIAAAEAAGARLVQVSSVAVYGDTARYASGSGATTEDTPLAPLARDAFYARSKRDAEALVLAAHAEGRLWATAVRPDVIYGTHDRQFVPRIARLLQHGIAPLVRGGGSRLAVVHAANVADGIVRAAASERAGGRAYNLANDFDVTVAEFFDLAAEGMGVRLRHIAIPYPAARAAVVVLSVLAPFLSGNRYRAALAASLDFMSRDNPFDSSRARRDLGWAPPVRPEAGVPEAFQWWRRHR
jgi:nucleoside-diphosphate-sugar epimerase